MNSRSQLTNGSVKIVTSESTHPGPSTRIGWPRRRVEALHFLEITDDAAQPKRRRFLGGHREHIAGILADRSYLETGVIGFGLRAQNQARGPGIGVLGLDDFGFGIDHRHGNGFTVAILPRQERDFLGKAGNLQLIKVMKLAVTAIHGLADVPHAGRFAEDDVAACQGHQGGEAEGSVVNVCDGFHVLDGSDQIGQTVGDRIDTAGTVYLKDDEVEFLLRAPVPGYGRPTRPSLNRAVLPA